MEIQILQENLLKGLSAVGKIVNPRPQLPVLANILLATDKGKIKISATNLETGISLWLPAKIQTEGAITLPAKTFIEFIASLPPDKISLKTDQTKATLECRNYRAAFNGISAVEFPSIPSLKNKPTGKEQRKIRFRAKELLEAINDVAFTAAQDETRPVLTGVKILFHNNGLRLVATDGYRLSIRDIKIEKQEDFPGMIVPAKALQEMARIFSQEDLTNKKIEAVLEANQVVFSIDSIEVITRVIEGEYPDYERIIPQNEGTAIVLAKDELLKAIKSAAIFAKDSANIVKFKVQNSKLKISANAPELGENHIELEIKQKGEDSQIAFNSRFLLEYLNVLEAEDLIFNLQGPLKAGVFKPLKNSAYLHIIMPVRVQE